MAAAERAKSLEAAADAVRGDAIELPGAMRWLRRRIRLVRRALAAAGTLLPERLASCPPTVLAFRDRLDTGAALVRLREAAAPPNFAALPPPLGCARGPAIRGHPIAPFQQRTGHDPPPSGS